jgi:hypothetical protein
MKLAQHVLMCVLSVKVRITKIETRKLIHGGPISCTKHMISIFSWTTGSYEALFNSFIYVTTIRNNEFYYFASFDESLSDFAYKTFFCIKHLGLGIETPVTIVIQCDLINPNIRFLNKYVIFENRCK